MTRSATSAAAPLSPSWAAPAPTRAAARSERRDEERSRPPHARHQGPQAAEKPAQGVERLDLRARGVPAGPAVVRGVRGAQPRLQGRDRVRGELAHPVAGAAELDALAHPAAVVHVEEGAARPGSRSRRRSSPGPSPRARAARCAGSGGAAPARAAGTRGPRPRRSAPAGGRPPPRVTVAPEREASSSSPLQRARSAPRSRMRTFTRCVRRVRSRTRASSAATARACDPGTPVSASCRSGIGVLDRHRGRLEPGLPDGPGPRRAHEPPVGHQQREVARGGRGHDRGQVVPQEGLGAREADQQGRPAPELGRHRRARGRVELLAGGLRPVLAEVAEGLAARGELPGAVDGLAAR